MTTEAMPNEEKRANIETSRMFANGNSTSAIGTGDKERCDISAHKNPPPPPNPLPPIVHEEGV
jgi:hypothetical protein